MTYGELEINTEITLKEKPCEENRAYKARKYTIIAKYPGMCIAVDSTGRRRCIAIGELIMNNIITQEPRFESLRNEYDMCRISEGWHKKNTKLAAGREDKFDKERTRATY